ncbi:unnamed protein product [Amoebophrya sp. A25]|nr:unnamed protein product [Amoebophrya sp. A25]|eukprot:GSA25T00026327001.1
MKDESLVQDLLWRPAYVARRLECTPPTALIDHSTKRRIKRPIGWSSAFAGRAKEELPSLVHTG